MVGTVGHLHEDLQEVLLCTRVIVHPGRGAPTAEAKASTKPVVADANELKKVRIVRFWIQVGIETQQRPPRRAASK